MAADRRFDDPSVEAVFANYPPGVRHRLLALRALIFETAAATDGVGALVETLKWGQPSYLTAESGSGSTIRIDRLRDDASRCAVYFNCQTSLVATFRTLYPDELSFGGNRSILVHVDDEVPLAALRHCIALALTYHRDNRRAGAARPARRMAVSRSGSAGPASAR